MGAWALRGQSRPFRPKALLYVFQGGGMFKVAKGSQVLSNSLEIEEVRVSGLWLYRGWCFLFVIYGLGAGAWGHGISS